ncbi:Thiamine-phosphate synthase [Ephemeroptericola cinctiostellae]|uniref:Thiamine-phosphate synthase n=1 Tax=Ephemeroptericola cinctiostellae TaxID=2268024 RepID=A0A345DAD9_9BURK|nr:thiamine phosphate synthase [Ephemeroptericola cinctiostellae]AXF85327.1 Thiamine-phosphate synthase [Ephemeroptericola cinctiostellae]
MQGLYAVTPNWDDTDLLLTATEEVIRGGARMVQYRHKDIDAAMRKIQASALQQLCRDYLVPFIINDDVDLCMELNADGIHVGGTDAPIADVRQRVGAHKIVGASCYGSMDLARAAARDGASYVAFGGFYPSLVKKYEVSTSANIVAQAKTELDAPVVVIGGMTVENCGVLIAQGADMVAAISSIYARIDRTKAAQEMSDLFKK